MLTDLLYKKREIRQNALNALSLEVSPTVAAAIRHAVQKEIDELDKIIVEQRLQIEKLEERVRL